MLEELDSRRDAKGAEICLFDYPHGLHPSCLDNFVHLRLNPFEQESWVVAKETLEKQRAASTREQKGKDISGTALR